MSSLLPFLPCSVQVAYNRFRYGLKEYGMDVDQICLDLFYWFKQSPCKREYFVAVLNDLNLEAYTGTCNIESSIANYRVLLEAYHWEGIREE